MNEIYTKPLGNLIRSTYLILLCLLLFQCAEDTLNCIEGSGNVISEDRALAEFKRIVVKTSPDVFLTQGFIQQVRVEAEDNLQPRIITSVSGGVLTIEAKDCIRNSEAVKVYVTIPVIEGIEITGSGSVEGTNPMVGKTLDIRMSGSGSLDMDLTYDEIHVSNTGSGNVNFSGAVIDQSIRLTGSGNYNAVELLSNTCDATLTGSGNAHVHVSDQLTATISGSGNVVYEGDPAIEQDVTGSGRVIKN